MILQFAVSSQCKPTTYIIVFTHTHKFPHLPFPSTSSFYSQAVDVGPHSKETLVVVAAAVMCFACQYNSSLLDVVFEPSNNELASIGE